MAIMFGATTLTRTRLLKSCERQVATIPSQALLEVLESLLKTLGNVDRHFDFRFRLKFR